MSFVIKLREKTFGPERLSRFKVQQIVEKLFWESFDVAQDERRISEMIEKFPFMLSVSKHSESFFNSLSRSETR
jgi:hypothetical protein